MKAYNESFLNSVNYKKYLDNNTIIRLLDARFQNNDDSNFQMDYEELTAITAIDHYMIKKMIDNEKVIPNSNFDIYIKKIRFLLQQQPLLLFQLPIKDIKVEQLKKYIPEIEFIKNSIINKRNNVHIIYDKFKQNPESLTVEEKKKLVEYFSYNVPTNNQDLRNAQENLVKYLLNESNLLSATTITFIIKFLGYKKIEEENLDATEIFVAKLEKQSNLGLSLGKSIIINKENLKRVTFKDNKLTDKFGRRNDGKCEGLAVLQTLFHELEHQVQDKEVSEGKKTDASYYMATRRLMTYLDRNEYHRNYLFQEIEKGANLAGWMGVRKVLHDYMPNYEAKEALERIFKYRYIEFVQNNLANRKDASQRMVYSNNYLAQSLDEVFQKYPQLMNDYPQFKAFYNDDNKPKSCVELLSTDDLSLSSLGFYSGQVIYRLKTTGFNKSEIDKLTVLEKKRVIQNIDEIFAYMYNKMRITNEYINKYKNGIQNIDSGQLKMFDINVIQYKNIAIRFYNYINKMLESYKELSNSELNINYYIDRINLYYGKLQKHIINYETARSLVSQNQIDNNVIEGENYGGK